jgi:hypothetical protein
LATLKTAQKKKQVIALIAIAIIAMGFGAGSLMTMASRSVQAPVYTQSTSILDELAAVDAQSFEYFEFTVSEDIANAAVMGSFSSAGTNFDNDIIISIVPESALQNIIDGEAYPAFYFSGRTSSGEVSAEILDRGKMYVIVDNRFSENPKTVDLDIERPH